MTTPARAYPDACIDERSRDLLIEQCRLGQCAHEKLELREHIAAIGDRFRDDRFSVE